MPPAAKCFVIAADKVERLFAAKNETAGFPHAGLGGKIEPLPWWLLYPIREIPV